MLPVIAIVGRPNVGKSTLFNRLTKSRDALVADEPGVTRDRQYGLGKLGNKAYIVIDTGGMGETDSTGIDGKMEEQSLHAMNEADIILFMVDARTGVSGADETVAKFIRKSQKPVYLLVNKIDGLAEDSATADFYSLGMGEPKAVAAGQGRGISRVIEEVLESLPDAEPPSITEGVKIALVGRPNVGKSTLTNRMLGEDRVIVFDEPGTTRDTIAINLERHGKHYTVIDTAGLRRRGKVDETVEKFSAVKTLQAINEANVAIMVIDGSREVSQQDLFLLSYILDSGRALVLAINKWDGLPQENKDKIKSEIERKLQFVNFAKIHFISALHGTGVGDLFGSVDKAFESATSAFSTSYLTKNLETAIEAHQPPMVRGRRIKLRYAHMGGHNPPIIVVHGNQVKDLPKSYARYLVQYFRKTLKLVGTPVRVQFKKGDNPFKDQKQKLTISQMRRKKRLMSHVKKAKKAKKNKKKNDNPCGRL